VVIPARNEAGNIEAAVERTPEMGLGTEIIFVEGHSKDNTWEEIQRVTAKYPQRRIKTLKQQSKGKGGAVREALPQPPATFFLSWTLTSRCRGGTAEILRSRAVGNGGICEWRAAGLSHGGGGHAIPQYDCEQGVRHDL